jgi:hypothetical protein
MYSGAQDDTVRTTHYEPGANIITTPLQDNDQVTAGNHRFGSAHASGCFFAMCDGSVQFVTFDVSPEVHRRLGNREDGEAVSLSEQASSGQSGTRPCP